MEDEEVAHFFREYVNGFMWRDIEATIRARANYVAALALLNYTEVLGGLSNGKLGLRGVARDCFREGLALMEWAGDGAYYKDFRVLLADGGRRREKQSRGRSSDADWLTSTSRRASPALTTTTRTQTPERADHRAQASSGGRSMTVQPNIFGSSPTPTIAICGRAQTVFMPESEQGAGPDELRGSGRKNLRADRVQEALAAQNAARPSLGHEARHLRARGAGPAAFDDLLPRQGLPSSSSTAWRLEDRDFALVGKAGRKPSQDCIDEPTWRSLAGLPDHRDVEPLRDRTACSVFLSRYCCFGSDARSRNARRRARSMSPATI